MLSPALGAARPASEIARIFFGALSCVALMPRYAGFVRRHNAFIPSPYGRHKRIRNIVVLIMSPVRDLCLALWRAADPSYWRLS